MYRRSLPCRARTVTTLSADRPMSPQAPSQPGKPSVRRPPALAATPNVPGIPARKGGLPTAIGAGVDEAALCLQSNHGPGRAARRYTQPLGPEYLMETFWALEL